VSIAGEALPGHKKEGIKMKRLRIALALAFLLGATLARLRMSVLTAVAATLTLALLAASTPSAGGSAPTRVQRQAKSSTRTGNANDIAHSLRVSGDGKKIFVTGDSDGGMKTGYDYATIAYDASNGKKLWLARYNGPANKDDGGESLTLSSDGKKLYVAGATFSKKTGYDYGTIAYTASTGRRLWVARYNGPRNGADGAEAVAVGADGTSVFVTGTSWGGKATDDDYATVAYNAATGKRRWVARYDGPGHALEEWVSLTISRDGTKVFVSGGSDGGDTTSFDYVVIAYDAASGAQLWVSRYDGPAHGFDEATSITASPDGTRVFVSGYSDDETDSEEATTIAYEAATGARLWVARYHGPGEDDDRGSSLKLSPDGTKVFVTGFSSGETDNDYLTVAYDSATGERLWVARYNGPANGYEWAHSLAVSDDGTKVFITGESEGRRRYADDYATIAYDASSGEQLWVARYNGPAKGWDVGGSVAASPVGSRVFVTGYSEGKISRADFATIAYGTRTGKRIWLARYNGPGVICLVPYVQGLPLARAKIEIRRADCAVGKVTRIASGTRRGSVDSQSPKAGTRLAPKSRVRLWVSRGPR
jgi:WD40 repeat protein